MKSKIVLHRESTRPGQPRPAKPPPTQGGSRTGIFRHRRRFF